MLGLAPWRRAPLLLARRPGVAFALAAAAFVAVLPAAAAPLFLSSARNATLHHQLEQGCPWLHGTHATGPLVPYGLPANGPTTVGEMLGYRAALAARQTPPGLSDPQVTATFPGGAVLAGKKDETPVHYLTRNDFLPHIQVRAGGPGPGVWVPDQFARTNGLAVGDTFGVAGATRHLDDGREVDLPPSPVRVTAIYTDLRTAPADPYWCNITRLYEGDPGQEFTNRPIPALLLLDRDSFTAVADGHLATTSVQIDWRVREPALTYPTGRALSGEIRDLHQALRADPVMGSERLRVSGRLPDFLTRAALVQTGLLPPVLPITGAGVAVGLLVVGAAGLFWVQRRRRELSVLAAHGAGPFALGVKALAEAAPALAAGTIGGWATAFVLVRWLGPTPVLAADAVPRSLLAAAAALVVALGVVGFAAGVRCRSLTDVIPPHRRVRLLALPWELLVVGLGVGLWFVLDDTRELTSDLAGSVAQVPGRLLVVPILVIIGTAALGARVATRWLRRPPGNGRRAARFLARRRLAREASVAAMLAAATAVPIAFAAYGATVTGSVRATLAAEARMIVGADVVLTLSEKTPVPAALAGRATQVGRLNGVSVGGLRTDVLVVDPDTFARGAFWDDRPAGQSLAEVLATLRDGGAVAGAPMTGGGKQVLWSGEEAAQLDVTAVPQLPAQQGGYPVLLITAARLGRLADLATPQLWVHGEPGEVRRTAAAAKLPLARVQNANELYANTLYEPLTYTFGYLAALSLLTGLITTVGLLLYLEGRAPAHRRAYALLRRMRLRPRQHRAALAMEITAPLLAGLVGGMVVAAVIVAVLADYFEINPKLEPGTVIAVPVAALAGTGGAVAVIAALAVTYAQRRVGRASPAEVLRDVT